MFAPTLSRAGKNPDPVDCDELVILGLCDQVSGRAVLKRCRPVGGGGADLFTNSP